MGCKPKHIVLALDPPQTIGNFLEISFAGRKCLCVSGKVALWSRHFDIRIWIPRFYLDNNIYIYIYMITRPELSCNTLEPSFQGGLPGEPGRAMGQIYPHVARRRQRRVKMR